MSLLLIHQEFKCGKCGKVFIDDFERDAHELDPHPTFEVRQEISDIIRRQHVHPPLSHQASMSCDIERVSEQYQEPPQSVMNKNFQSNMQASKLSGLELNGSLKSIPDKTAINTELFAFVFFDLQTGDFKPETSDILEICAKFGDNVFHSYIKPTQAISRGANQVHKLDIVHGNLQLNNTNVAAYPLANVLKSFIFWLQVVKTISDKKVILVAHNARFDADFLMFYMTKENHSNEIEAVVQGFIDTLSAFKHLYPNLGHYSLERLVKYGSNRQLVHGATPIVRDLEELFFQRLFGKIVDYADFFYHISSVTTNMKNLLSFRKMVNHGIISWTIASKMTQLGYNVDSLVLVLNSSGEEEIIKILTDRDRNLLPKVTGNPTFINNILNGLYFHAEL